MSTKLIIFRSQITRNFGAIAILVSSLSCWSDSVLAESITVTSSFALPPPLIVAGVGQYSKPDGVLRIQPDAVSYCAGLDGEYSLPSQEQLKALYSLYPDGGLRALGWPDTEYWSATPHTTANNFYRLLMSNGYETTGHMNNAELVTCILPES